MITLYPYEELGHANHGWLDARYHFSFASYHDPARRGFGVLRVINDDVVAAGNGFDTHPHRDMEIITYVRKGAITHRDSQGNQGRTSAGNVQVMSAGTGIFHSEYNLESEDTNLYQIWIEPARQGVKPRWDMRAFPQEPVRDALSLLVSGQEEEGALTIHQDARIHAGRLLAGTRITHPITHQAYVLASQGELEVDGVRMKKGDGAEVTNVSQLVITALTDAEVLVIDVPARAPHH
jgi:redox-sensitive bicupin YhaK (pirin superfamily)